MMLPEVFGRRDNLFDDLFEWPRMFDFGDVDRKLYGKHGDHLMKTDVKEKENGYEVAIDLPGFKKDEINLGLDHGYLTVSASKSHGQEDKDDKGRVIRQERYSGAMQRSFYVGEHVTEEDVKAKFENGVLCIDIPKKEEDKLPEKKLIAIEG